MSRSSALLLALLLAGCFGGKREKDNDVRVQPMAYDGSTLGFAQISLDDDWRVNIWIADVLEHDADGDKDVRVAIHELAHARAMDESPTGGLPTPDGYGPHWYTHDGDTKPPFYPVPPEEGRWFAANRSLEVHVVAGQAWLDPVMDEACARINASAGRAVFLRPVRVSYYPSVIWVWR